MSIKFDGSCLPSWRRCTGCIGIPGDHGLNMCCTVPLETAMRVEDTTLVELMLLLVNRSYRDDIVGEKSEEPGRLDPREDGLLISFWHDYFFKLGSTARADTVASTLNKIAPFLLDSMMRNIIGQQMTDPTKRIDLKTIMDEGKILFINLAKGDLGEVNSSLLGSIIVNLILIAALRRRDEHYDKNNPRRQFHLIVDEYQNFANPSFSILQSEARKFGVDVMVAHQYRDQLDEDSRGASMNVGNVVSFRVSGRDSRMLASQYDNTPPPADLEWQPDRRPATGKPGMWERGNFDKQRTRQAADLQRYGRGDRQRLINPGQLHRFVSLDTERRTRL